VPLIPPQLTKFPVGAIEEHADVLHQGATLFIPAVSVRKIADEELLRNMDELAHLKSVTVDTSVK
jgi:hypothetical protein